MATGESRTLTWEVLGLTVEGTLTLPTTADRNISVIFVAGSGPTDRDWCSPLLPGSNGSARLLAEDLARRGITTLRYDKLGSGPRAKENAAKLVGQISMKSHLEELAGGVRALRSAAGVDQKDIFVLANSEGCIHAVNHQLEPGRPRFRGLVLTGCPGRSIGAEARTQLAEQGRSLPNLQEFLGLYDQAVDRFIRGEPANPSPNLPEGVRRIFQGLENPANLPFSRELWTYDLSTRIGRVAEPVLVLIGKKDVQIDWTIDGAELEKSTVAKQNISFSYPEEANHVLKHEVRPRDQLNGAIVGPTYNSADAGLDEVAVGRIVDWILERAQGPPEYPSS